MLQTEATLLASPYRLGNHRVQACAGLRPAEARALLDFLGPLFEEREMDAVKGVGWGLKTLGRYYPDLTASWLERQLVQQQRRPRPLMVRKALKFLSVRRATRQRDAGNVKT